MERSGGKKRGRGEEGKRESGVKEMQGVRIKKNSNLGYVSPVKIAFLSDGKASCDFRNHSRASSNL